MAKATTAPSQLGGNTSAQGILGGVTTAGLTDIVPQWISSTAVNPKSTSPDASEQGFGGYGNLTGQDQSMPNSLNNNLVNPGGFTSGFLTGLYGGKWQEPDPTTTALDAIVGNTSNLGADQSLTLGTDTISAEGAALPFQENLPGYEANLNQASANTNQELSGQLPQDVQNQIQEQAAARGISTGQGADSPNDNAALLASLGLNSLQEQSTGMAGLSTLIGETPTGTAFNPSTEFVTPEQQQTAQLNANKEAAAPQPQLAGLAGYFGI